jgi:fumarate reductase subunit D
VFLSAAFWSVVGLCASSYMPNKFVALCTPFIISFFLNRFTYTFPIWLRLNRISEGMCKFNGTVISLAYATLVYTVLTTVAGLIFVKNAKRRLANG